MRGGTAPPFLLCRSGSPTLFSSSPAAAASSGHCGAVAMEMWVRALMCERSVDLALAEEYKQPGLEPAVNSG